MHFSFFFFFCDYLRKGGYILPTFSCSKITRQALKRYKWNFQEMLITGQGDEWWFSRLPSEIRNFKQLNKYRNIYKTTYSRRSKEERIWKKLEIKKSKKKKLAKSPTCPIAPPTGAERTAAGNSPHHLRDFDLWSVIGHISASVSNPSNEANRWMQDEPKSVAEKPKWIIGFGQSLTHSHPVTGDNPSRTGLSTANK